MLEELSAGVTEEELSTGVEGSVMLESSIIGAESLVGTLGALSLEGTVELSTGVGIGSEELSAGAESLAGTIGAESFAGTVELSTGGSTGVESLAGVLSLLEAAGVDVEFVSVELVSSARKILSYWVKSLSSATSVIT